MVVELKEHQKKPVEELDNGKILCGDVGTGKTITSLAYFFTKECGGELNKLESLKTPVDLYVITTANKRDKGDWQNDAALFSIVQDPAYSVGNIKLTVDSWNNIDKYKEISGAFFIFDEQRLVGSGAWTKSFLKIARNNRWILLSATPGDVWLDYIPVFVANGFYRNRTDFKRQHVVYNTFSKFPKVDRYISVGRLIKHRNNLLVQMPMERHTTRHIREICVDYDVDKFEKVVKKRWHVFENRPLKDVSELFSVMRKVVNSDASRMDTLRDLMTKHPKVIVFYNFDYELEELRKLAWEPPMRMSEFATSGPTLAQTRPVASTQGAESQAEREPPMRMSDFPTHREGFAEPSTTQSVSGGNTASKSSISQPSTSSFKAGSGSTSTVAGSSGPSLESLELGSLAAVKSSLSPRSVEVLEKLMSDGSSVKSSSAATSSGMEVSIPTGNVPTADGSTTAQKWMDDSSDSETSGPIALTVAEWNGHKHEKIPETDRWVYLVQYRAGAEGWNCVDTNAMVFYSLTYSYRDFHQAHGRIDRLNTPFSDLYYYILKSNSLIDKAIAKALRQKRNFNELDFLKNR